MIGILVEGKVVQHSVTIPEGLTSEQIISRLTDNDLFSGTIREVPREGTMLPETYKFPRGTTREQVIQRMQAAQKRLVAEIWDHRSPDVPLKSPEQLVTLASIVEKETGKADERSRVAAVFVNRLQKKMKLQSDPTIIYGLVGGKGTLGRPIKRSEITQPSPYNTYTIDGLPPGPIANPGRASLEAAANPARTRDLFFVADGTGGHAFSELLDAHQKNVAKLRAIEKQTQNDRVELPDDAPAAAAAPARRGRAGRATLRLRRSLRRSRPPPRAHPHARAPRAGAAPHGAAIRGMIRKSVKRFSDQISPTSRTPHFLKRPYGPRAFVARANLTLFSFCRRLSRHGAVEHDRLRPKPRGKRALRVRMGIEIGQRQGL